MNTKAIITPTHWVYLLLHLILSLIGYVIIKQSVIPILTAIGASLIAAGITGWVIFIYVWLTDDTRAKLKMLSDFGLTSAFISRGSSIKSEYDKRLNSAKECIDIMGFGLRHLRQDYREAFSTWKTRATVRILLLDPEFPNSDISFGRQRDVEENDTAGTINNDVKSFITDVAPLLGDQFTVRLYRCLPTVNIFRVDDEIFWGPYLIGRVSRNSPTFVVRHQGELFSMLEEHFNEIWTKDAFSRPVPEDWLKTKP